MTFQPGRSWPNPRGQGSGPRRELRAQQPARSVGAHRAEVRPPLAGHGPGAAKARGCTSAGHDRSVASTELSGAPGAA
eukprot:5648192-Alexandrium_andersonii.AAC.1